MLNEILYSRADLAAALEVGDSVLVVAVSSPVVPVFMSWRPLIVDVDSCCITVDFCIS